MTIEIPGLTIASFLFFLFALLLTSFAKWFSGVADKKTATTPGTLSGQSNDAANAKKKEIVGAVPSQAPIVPTKESHQGNLGSEEESENSSPNAEIAKSENVEG